MVHPDFVNVYPNIQIIDKWARISKVHKTLTISCRLINDPADGTMHKGFQPARVYLFYIHNILDNFGFIPDKVLNLETSGNTAYSGISHVASFRFDGFPLILSQYEYLFIADLLTYIPSTGSIYGAAYSSIDSDGWIKQINITTTLTSSS